MTTLRTFQNEIHEIQNREVSKQRAQLTLDKEREVRDRKHTNLKGKAKEDQAVSDVHEPGGCNIESGHEGLQLEEIEEQILVRHDYGLCL